ncbi:BRO1 domain-containing protein BROX-like [Ptychodera flava]|uniref:BRO1 domain-containing protein BROX-like n=1 Tax=Ptychodera flava TaxID=63121 RepID=UPI003969FECE
MILCRFYWLNTVGSEVTIHFDDANFDFASIMMKTALWIKERGIVVLADPENLLWAGAIFECMLELTLNGTSPDLKRQDIEAMAVQCTAEALMMRCRDNREFLRANQCRDLAILACHKFEEMLSMIDATTDSGKKWKEFIKFKYNLCCALARTFQSKTYSEMFRHEEAMSAVKHAKHYIKLARERAEGFDVFDPASIITLGRGEEFRRIDFLVDKRIQECEKVSNLKWTDDMPIEAGPLQLSPNSDELLDERVFQLPQIQYDPWLGASADGGSVEESLYSSEEFGYGEEPSCCIRCLSGCFSLPRRFVRWICNGSSNSNSDEEKQIISIETKQYGSGAGSME